MDNDTVIFNESMSFAVPTGPSGNGHSSGQKAKKRKRSSATPVKNEMVEKKPMLAITNEDCERNLASGVFGTMERTDVRAAYWTCFDQVVDESGARVPFVQCRLCRKIMRRADNAGSQAFSQHATRCQNSALGMPPQLQEQAPKQAVIERPKEPAPTVSQESRDRIARAVARVCISESVSFSALTGENIASLLEIIHLEFLRNKNRSQMADYLPSPEMLSYHVTQEALDLRSQNAQHLVHQVQNFGGAVTLDMRKNNFNGIIYLTGTYTYINDIWERHSALLFCAEVDIGQKHDAHWMNNFVFDRLAQFGLSKELCRNLYFVTESGSWVEQSFSTDSELKVLGSAVHGVEAALARCFDRSKSKLKLLDDIDLLLDLLSTNQSLAVVLEEPHREREALWSQDRVTSAKITKLRKVLDRFDVLKDSLRDWDPASSLPITKEALEEFCAYMAPFEDAIQAVSSGTDLTIHLVAPHLARIAKCLERSGSSKAPAFAAFQVSKPEAAELNTSARCNRSQNEQNSEIFGGLLENVGKNVKLAVSTSLVADDLHKIAVFFNPAMKKMTFFTRSEADAVIATIRQMLPVDEASIIKTEPLSGERKKTEVDFSEFEEYSESSGGNSAATTDELEYYLASRPPPAGFDLLEYWKVQERMLPNLACIARQILSIPACTVSPQDLFADSASLFLGKFRDGLSKEVFEDMLCLSWYSEREVFSSVNSDSAGQSSLPN